MSEFEEVFNGYNSGNKQYSKEEYAEYKKKEKKFII